MFIAMIKRKTLGTLDNSEVMSSYRLNEKAFYTEQ